ncbi:SDR family NAD(P)-dependent oxidoreductase [Halorussus lipolyticus]|uniref:SDR family NAD(P)-dependent oxidoreductase n=1 Tax=Halorussus lipolyticus TaxID=3034024 RepID=UPI0023E882A0|nr:SDR family NAD(P)-dependent oxidoreductase [Halorussus sp. DT80]
MDFENDVVLVTGAASGIGAATSRRFAERGATVVVTDIDVDAGKTVAEDIREAGGDAVFAELDVSDAEAFQSVVDTVVEDYGRIDVLCNNAGISGTMKAIEDITEEERDRVFDVNINGAWNGCRAVAPIMKEQGEGAIVNTASAVGLRGYTPVLPYATSKAAIVNFTRSLAGRLGPTGVRVNAVCPGMVETKMLEEHLSEFEDPESVRERGEDLHVLGRFAEPEEIANCINFLASDEASFVTGHAFVADGGCETVIE